MNTQVENAATKGQVATKHIVGEYLKLMRPKQWLKNGFIFAAVIFSMNLDNNLMLLRSAMAFSIFCLLSSSVYILNDLIDMEKDRQHPVKKMRPLASERIRPLSAMLLLFVILLTALYWASLMGSWFLLVSAGYVILVGIYSILLKNIVIVDVIFLAFGFVLRAVAGAVVITVRISPWLLVCTFLLALFIGLNKRRHEIVLLKGSAVNHRVILKKYSIPLLDQLITMASSVVIMAYSLYTFTSGHSIYLMATIPFVIYGLFRYYYLCVQKDGGGSPEIMVLTDFPLLVNLFLWVLTSIFILYVL